MYRCSWYVGRFHLYFEYLEKKALIDQVTCLLFSISNRRVPPTSTNIFEHEKVSSNGTWKNLYIYIYI